MDDSDAGRGERVERYSGIGTLSGAERAFEGVRYDIIRYQRLTGGGLPVPGLHRIEGAVDLTGMPAAADLVGQDLTLRLEDGRGMRVTLADVEGRVFALGHGPSRCGCC